MALCRSASTFVAVPKEREMKNLEIANVDVRTSPRADLVIGSHPKIITGHFSFNKRILILDAFPKNQNANTKLEGPFFQVARKSTDSWHLMESSFQELFFFRIPIWGKNANGDRTEEAGLVILSSNALDQFRSKSEVSLIKKSEIKKKVPKSFAKC